MGVVTSELIARARFFRWISMARSAVEAGSLSWRGVLSYSLSPWIPAPLWVMRSRMRGEYGGGLTDSTAVNPARLRGLRASQRLRTFGQDFYFRPTTDTVRARLSSLLYSDPGNFVKGALAGWGVDHRIPTTDRRVVEFCLSVPNEQFFHRGRPRSLARRALADRVPDTVLEDRLRGYQAIDWHEGLEAGKNEIIDELRRLDGLPAAAAMIDLPLLHRLVSNWPEKGWERDEVRDPYRYALLRALSVGHFLRKSSETNPSSDRADRRAERQKGPSREFVGNRTEGQLGRLTLLARLRRLGAVELGLLCEAFFLLLLSSAAIRLLPFSQVGRIACWPLKPGEPTARETLTDKIAWAVRACSQRTPWRPVCFQQGLAAQIMLRRRGVNSTLFFGAATDEVKELAAHVWVRDGDRSVVGMRTGR